VRTFGVVNAILGAEVGVLLRVVFVPGVLGSGLEEAEQALLPVPAQDGFRREEVRSADADTPQFILQPSLWARRDSNISNTTLTPHH